MSINSTSGVQGPSNPTFSAHQLPQPHGIANDSVSSADGTTTGYLGLAYGMLTASDKELIEKSTGGQFSDNPPTLTVQGSKQDFEGARNFVDAIAVQRSSMQSQVPITASMITSIAQPAIAKGHPLDQDYIANALGYFNGLS